MSGFSIGKMTTIVEGESFRRCHIVRDGGAQPRPLPSERYDIIIVGAGISGMTCALKIPSRFSVKVLEKENRFGGASKRGIWNGIHYSCGAADTGSTYGIEWNGKKLNYTKELFDELMIPWRVVQDPTSAFFYNGELIIDPFGGCQQDVRSSLDVRKSFEMASKRIESLIAERGAPVIPAELSPKAVLELDKIALSKVLEGLGAPFNTFLNRFCEATFGASPQEVSAFEGLYYLSKEEGARYACAGGNGCVADALGLRLAGKIETGATVISISQNGSECLVTYITGPGKAVTIEAGAVIMASEKHYAPYIINNLPEDKKRAFQSMEYNSYVVANIFTNSATYREAFATYFDRGAVSDLVVADWVTAGKSRKPGGARTEPGIYTAYCPIATKDRASLLVVKPEAWSERIINDLKISLPSIASGIAEVRIYRYGHHYIIGKPGFITNIMAMVKKPFGRVLFAKDDIQGVPCLEGAIWSGYEAAEKAIEILEK